MVACLPTYFGREIEIEIWKRDSPHLLNFASLTKPRVEPNDIGVTQRKHHLDLLCCALLFRFVEDLDCSDLVVVELAFVDCGISED